MLIGEIRSFGDGGPGLSILLHPRLTVATGLGPEEQVGVADLIGAAVYGRPDGLGGWVELHGTRIPVEEWARVVGASLDQFDIFVRPGDLPSAGDEPHGTVDVASLEELAARARAAEAAAREEVVLAGERLGQAITAREQAAAALDALRAGAGEPDPAAPSGGPDGEDLAALRQHQADASLRVAAAEAAEVAAEAALVEAEAARADAARAHADAEARLEQAASDRRREAAASAEQRVREARATAERLAAEAVAARDAAHAAIADAAASPDAARSDTDLRPLQDRVGHLEDELARARAEAELLADFADTNTGDWRTAVAPWVDAPPGSPGGDDTPAGSDAVTVAKEAAERAEEAAQEAEARARREDAELDELRRAAGAARKDRDGVGHRRAALQTHADSLQQRIDDLSTRLAGRPRIDAADVARVSEAADRLRYVPSPEQVEQAGALLPGFDRVLSAREQFARRAAPRWLVDNARNALEEARIELARAEEMARPMEVDPEDAANLEAAHRAVSVAEVRADRRFAGPMVRRRLDAALAEQQEILDRIGVPTYSAYLLRTVPISSDSDAAAKLEDARRAMADAEAVWNELRELEMPEELAVIEEKEARLLADAAVVLGRDRVDRVTGSTPAATLGAVRETLERMASSVGNADELAAALLRVLPEAEGAPAAPLDVPAALARADQWLLAARQEAEETEVLGGHIAEARGELEEVRAALQALEDGSVGDADGGVADAEHRAAAAAATARAAREAADAAAAHAGRLAEGAEVDAAEAARAARARAEVEDALQHVDRLAEELAAARRALADAEVSAPVARQAGSCGASPTGGSDVAFLTTRAAGAERAARDAAARLADAEAEGAGATAGAGAAAEADSGAAGDEDRLRAARRALSTAAAQRVEADRAAVAARAARREAERELAAANQLFEQAVRGGADRPPVDAAVDPGRRQLEDAEAAVRQLMTAEADAQQELNRARAVLQGAQAEVARVQDELVDVRQRLTAVSTVEPSSDDAEIYVLSRVAAARAVGEFGAMPLILVDPFTRFTQSVRPILDLLRRMSVAVQMIYLTEDPAVVAWATELGPDASVVRFGAPDDRAG